MKLQLSDGTNLILDDSLTDDEAMQLWYSAEDQLKSDSSGNELASPEQTTETPVAQTPEQPVAEQGIAGKALDWMMKPEPQKPVDTSIDNQELSTTEEALQRAKKFAAELYNSPIETYRKSVEDLSLSMGKGLISAPEFIVGIADMASGGQVGKSLEDNGVNFQEAKDWLTSRQTSEEQAIAKEREAEPTFGGTVRQMAMHPLSTLNVAAESLPASYVGGRIGGAVQGIKALGKASGMLGAGAGEFIVGSGQAEEGIRQQTPDRLTTPEQSALALGAGTADAFLAGIGSVAAKKLGIGDIDTLRAGARSAEMSIRDMAKQILGSMGIEGGEELTQSTAEQIIENYALDKPSLFEGVPNAAAIGMVTGTAMGGGHALTSTIGESAQTITGDELLRQKRAEDAKNMTEDERNAYFAANGGKPQQAPIDTTQATTGLTTPTSDQTTSTLQEYENIFTDENLTRKGNAPDTNEPVVGNTAPIVDNQKIDEEIGKTTTADDAIKAFTDIVEANSIVSDISMANANKIADRFTKTKEVEITDKDYQDAVQLEQQLSTVRDELAYKKMQKVLEAERSDYNGWWLDVVTAQEIDIKNQQLKEILDQQLAKAEASIPSVNQTIENEQWVKTRNNRNAVIQMVFDRDIPAENIFPAIKAELKRQGFKDTELSQDDIDAYRLLKASPTTPVVPTTQAPEIIPPTENEMDVEGLIKEKVEPVVSEQIPATFAKVNEWARNGAIYKNGMLIDTKGKKFLLNKAQREYYLTTKPSAISKTPVALTEQGYNETQQGQDTITGAPSFKTGALKEVLDTQIKERIANNRETRNLSSVNQRIEEQQWIRTRNNRNAAIQTVFDKNVSASNIEPAIKAELKRQGFKDTELSEDDINAYELLRSSYGRRKPEIANAPVDIGVQQPVSSKRTRLVRQGVNAGEQVTEGQQGQDVITNFVEPSTPVRQESDALRKVDEWLQNGATYKNGMLFDSKGKKFVLNTVQREYYLNNRPAPIANAPVDMGEVGNAPRKRYMGVKQQGVNAGEQMTGSISQDQISGVEEEQPPMQPVAKKKPVTNNLNKITGLEPIEVAIGKLGGINREIANREGFSDFKGRYFTKTSSESFDGMALLLADIGYDVDGGNDLVAKLRESLDADFGTGKKVYTSQGIDKSIEQMFADKADQDEQKQDELLNTYTSEEVNAILDAKTQAEKDQLMKDFKAEKKRKADQEVDTVVDEMKGTGMTTSGDLFAPKIKEPIAKIPKLERNLTEDEVATINELVFGSDEFLYLPASNKGILISKFNEYSKENPDKAKAYLTDLYNELYSEDDSNIKFSKAKVSKSDDAKYLAAVEAGDMETAQEMVNLAAENAGYGMSDYQMSHEAPNRNDYPINDLTTIYPEDIYSSSAVNYYGDGQPSDSEAIAKLQRMRGKKPNAAIMVYRAVPNDVKESMPRNGDWVSTTRAYAEEHGKRWLPDGYRVMEIVTTVGNIFTDGNSIHELGFDDGKEYGYANTKNNRKLIDAVTYDDDANVIPLSKRFNKRSDDIRFSKAAKKVLDDNPLAIVHNLKLKNLVHADKMGGLPAPSIAVVNQKYPLSGFGEITLIGDTSQFAPEADKANRFYNADVYSPRYPNVTYIVDSKAVSNANEALSDDAKVLANAMGRSGLIDKSSIEDRGLVDGLTNNSVLQYEFLKTIGKAPKMQYKPNKVPPANMKKFIASKVPAMELKNDPNFVQAVTDTYNESIRKRNEILKQNKPYFEAGSQQALNLASDYQYMIEEFRNQKGAQKSIDTYATSKLIREKTNQAQYEKWLVENYSNLITDERIFNGFTNAGNRIYLPHNLDTVVKLMTKTVKGGEKVDYGIGTIRAHTAKQFKTVKAIQAARGEIVSAEKLEALKEELSNEFENLSEELRPYSDYSNPSATDALSDLVSKGTRAFKESYQDVPAETMTKVYDFLDKLKNMPAHYFEAKIGRAVKLNEFAGALVPKGKEYDEAVKILNANGVTKIKRYTENDSQSRSDALLNFSELLFSQTQEPTADNHTEQSLKEGLTQAGDDAYGKGWTDRLFASGMFKIISALEANKIVGKGTMFHKAWHGSPYDYSKFDSSYMGTGEGAQAFGWGHYFTDTKRIAEWYREKLSYSEGGNSDNYTFKGEKLVVPTYQADNSESQDRETANQIAGGIVSLFSYGNKEITQDAINEGKKWATVSMLKNQNYSDLKTKEIISALENAKPSDFEYIRKGKLYEVELAPTQEEYLDWNKPMSQQSDKVLESLKQWAEDSYPNYLSELEWKDKNFPNTIKGLEKLKSQTPIEWMQDLFNEPNYSGEDFYKELSEQVGYDEDASRYLNSMGIRGIRFKAEGGKSEDNNYVIFDDRDINIEAKYSMAGDIEAFFNPADGKTYFVAENIDKATDLHYLMMHEVGVHALNMGGNKEEFESILKQVDNLIKVKNPAALKGRQDALDADTPQEDLREETLAYLLKYAPKLKIVERFKAWLKNALRNMAKMFPAAQRLGFIQWANKLSDQDLLYIANATLRKAPEMLGATGQNVKFSKNTPSQNPDGTFNIPAETSFQFLRKWIQDDLLRIRVVMDRVREQGGKVDESNDVVLAMEAAGNIAANQLEKLKERYIQPLIDRMAKMNVNKDEIGLLLYAKGAPSRNAYIQSINPNFRKLGEGGSGMTDAESAAIIQRYKDTMGDKYAEFEKLTDDWQKIQNIVKNILVASGDISPEQAEEWDSISDYHVPMKGFEEVDEVTGKARKSSRGNIGQGFSISGKFDRRALGRQSRANQIVENIVMNLERAVIRSSKMYVQSTLYKLVEDNPDINLWENEVTPMKPIMGKAKAQYVMYFHGSEIGVRDTLRDARRYVEAETARTGQEKREYKIVKVGGEPQVTLMRKPYDQNEEISYWRNGKQVRILVKDEEFVQAFNRLGDENIYSMFKTMAAYNRFLRHSYTILNPAFIIANGVMVDPAVALYTNTARQGFKYASTVLAKTPMASLQIAKYMAKGSSGNAEWDNAIRLYYDNGGKSGAAFISSIEQKADELNLAVLKSKMLDTKFYEYPLDKLKLILVENKLANFLKYLGEVGETATRLSTFKVAIDNGKSPQEAAKIARNVTINFNRRGVVGRELGAMYLFLNASIQGTENLVDATINGEHKVQAAAMLSTYVTLGYLIALLGGDDGDDDLIPEEEKTRFLSVTLDEKTGLRVDWKLPYGLSFFKDMGTAIARIQLGGDPEKITNKLMSSFFNNFSYVNPMVSGEWNAKDLISGLIPTAGRIPFSINYNRNQWGKPIYPEDVYDTTIPDSEKEWSTTRGTMFADFAKWMNKVTGGTKVESGLIDISPESMKYTLNALTGSVGTQAYKFVNSLYTSSMNGEEMSVGKLPLVSNFVKEDTIDAYRRVYTTQRKEAEDINDKFKKYEKLADDAAIDKFVTRNQSLLDFYDETKSIIKDVKDLRKKQDEARIEGDKQLLKELENDEKELLIEYNYQYNRR